MYHLFIALYQSAISVAALWNKKAKQWKQGRRQLFTVLEAIFPHSSPVVWVHAASAGEFEQAKPLIEALKTKFPHHKVLVSFFSPSGYQQGKKWGLADFVCYLPVDTKRNAQRFLTVVQPSLVIFIKYDFWYHHLQAVHGRNIPLLLVSSIFRKGQPFFQWYGSLHRSMLRFFTHLFVQDDASVRLLQQNGFTHVSCSGDTRFDRVAAIAENFQPVDGLKNFSRAEKIIVAGSTWAEDERMLAEALQDLPGVKMIVAPHEIHAEHIAQIEKNFPQSIRYSQLHRGLQNEKMLIIDNVGMLSRLYHEATITYVGGGFNKSGIHNTLEAAVWAKPVVFGPNFEKFREAKDLLACGGAFTYSTVEELKGILKRLLEDDALRVQSSAAAAAYVRNHKGATEKIMDFIQEKRLLTS